MLEALPYNIFMNLVLKEKIEGKDLISLCNSSPLINQKCNRGFAKTNGEIVPQFIFYNLLQKMGIDPNQYANFGSKDYRAFYIKTINHKLFQSVKDKIDFIFKVIEQEEDPPEPRIIYTMFYDNPDYVPSLILSGRGHDFFAFPNEIFAILHELWEESTQSKMKKLDLEELAKDRKMSKEEFMDGVIKRITKESDVKPADVENFDSIFLKVLRKWTFSREEIKSNINNRVKRIFEIYDRREEEIFFSDEELNYLIGLHERVLNGTLPVSTFFSSLEWE